MLKWGLTGTNDFRMILEGHFIAETTRYASLARV